MGVSPKKKPGAQKKIRENTHSALSKADRKSVLVAILALIPLFYLLLFYRPSTLSKSKIVGKLVTSESLKRRHSRSLSWGALNEGETVYVRDIVYTPPGTTAVFILNGDQRIEIEPDSMVQFDEVTLDTINITLYGGSVRGMGITMNDRDPLKLKPYQVGKLLPYIPDVEPFELRNSEFSDRMNQRIRRNLGLQKPNDAQEPELPLNTLEYYSIELLAPEENDVLPIGRNTWVETLWTPVPLAGVRYEINVSKDKDFGQSITHETDVNGLELMFRDESAFFWQVRAIVGKQETRSKVGRFIMSRQSSSPSNRVLAQKDLSGFLLEISKDKGFKKIVSSIVASNKKCSPLALPKGTYWCRVSLPDRSRKLAEYKMNVK